MASIDLNPIDGSNFDAATSMLTRGFPDRSRAFWASGLKRILTMHDAERHPVGYLMKVGGDDAGIVLTIPSRRQNGADAIDVVHLAAWYIEEKYRWLAALMMKKVVAARDTVFLDLTPNEASQVINRKLGFDILNEGFLIYLLPLTAWRLGGTAEVMSLERAAAHLAANEREMLEQHRALGCITGALKSGAKLSPIVFSPMQRRGLPGARVIHAVSKAMVVDNLGAISRFLLRRKVLFLRMDATRKDSAAGSYASRWNEPTYIKGATGGAELDLTYSEFVFLGT